MTLCLTNNALSLALVLPITVASVLLQFDFATSVRSALSLVAVNLLSGVLASLAFAFVELRPSLPFLFLTVFLVGLILGGRAAAGRAKMYAGALTTFLILFGSGIAPLPTTTPESFATSDRLRPVGGRVHSVHDGATLAARTICVDTTLTAVSRARCDSANALASSLRFPGGGRAHQPRLRIDDRGVPACGTKRDPARRTDDVRPPTGRCAIKRRSVGAAHRRLRNGTLRTLMGSSPARTTRRPAKRPGRWVWPRRRWPASRCWRHW